MRWTRENMLLPFPHHGRNRQQQQQHVVLLLVGLLLLLDGSTATLPAAASSSSSSSSSALPLQTDAHSLAHTRLGIVRGAVVPVGDTTVTTFLGVPFAESPIGDLRFGKPKMRAPWEGVLEADKPTPPCFYTPDTMFPMFPGAEMWNPQNVNLSEANCLSLNIYVPARADGSVMVWIYGGGFFSGSPSLDLYDGRVLAARRNTIVVNINYRLGPFGFLYLGRDSAAPGNMGLLDQQLALRWVHENIQSFGGSPSRIVLFGESAGAASATSHLFAPASHPFFHRIIAKSGAIVNSWATRSPSVMLNVSLELAKHLDCMRLNEKTGDLDSDATLGCMRNIPAAKIQKAADVVSENIALPMTFAFVPVEEDANFFQGNVHDRLRSGDFKRDVSILLGTVQDEGTYWLPYYVVNHGFRFNHTIAADDPANGASITQQQFDEALDSFSGYFAHSQLVSHALRDSYGNRLGPEKKSAGKERRDGVAAFLGDYFFTCGVLEFADALATQLDGPVYSYYFQMRSSANPWPRWMGTMHGYEIEYVFGVPFRRPQLYDAARLPVEQRFSDLVMQLWTDFAKSGRPAVYWPAYDSSVRQSLALDEFLATEGHHRLVLDVHGPRCRMLEEARLLAAGYPTSGTPPSSGSAVPLACKFAAANSNNNLPIVRTASARSAAVQSSTSSRFATTSSSLLLLPVLLPLLLLFDSSSISPPIIAR